MITESTPGELRKTGISTIGEVPWGTHFCCFYETKQDLLETLVLYFKAGLENEEFCVWVLSQALTVEEAKQALETAVPDLERHLAQGDLEIHSHADWYLRNGRWDAERVLQSWRDKIGQSLTNGYAGLRVSGDGGWTQDGDWLDFREYEKRVDGLILEKRTIVLCTYPLATSPGVQVFDVAHIHQRAVARRNGNWETIETSALKEAKAEIRRLNQALEQKVEERTRELAAANAALRTQIVERQLAVDSLKRAEDRIRLVIDTIPTMAWTLGPDGGVDFVNQRWIDYTGLSLEQEVKEPARPIHPEDLPRVMAKWLVDSAAGELCEDEMRLRRADGEYRWFLVRTAPLFDEQGNIVSWYGTSTDIEERKRAEEALRKSERLFTAFMDHLPGYAWMKDVEGRYVYVNETFLQLRNAVGKTDAELWPAEMASTYRANDNQVIQTKNALQIIEPFPKDPEQGCQIVSKFPILDQDGAVVMVGGASVDISDLVQAEKALDAQSLRYKTLMEMSTDSIYVLDADGNLQEANAAFLRQRGYTAAEVKGLNLADWDARWTPLQLQKRLRKLVGSSAVFETRHRSKDGSLFDVEVSATSVRIGGKHMFFCVTRDITERKKAERALRESETRFRQLVENLDEAFWISDPEGSTTIYVSPAYERIWGRSCESLYAEPKSWRDSIHPEDRPRMETIYAADPGATGENTYRIVRPDGSVRWIHDRGCPVRDENGNVVRFAGIAQDITERQRAEEATAQLAAIVRSSSDAIIGMDLSGIITTWNRGAERIFAFGADEMVGGPITRVIPPDRREEEEQVFNRIRQGENVEHFETAGIEKGGSQIDLSLTVSPIRNAVGDIVGASLVARDITGLKQTQEALRTSEERFRELAENIREVFWMSDPENTRIIYISPAYEVIWGRSRETLYASPTSWMDAIHPEDKERMIHARAHFAQGMLHDNTYRIVRPDGSIRWIRDRGFPVRDEHGLVVRFAGIAGDITEQKRAEERLREYEKVVEGLEEMIVVVDRDYRYLLANRAFLNFRGLEREQLIGRRVADVLGPEAFAGVVGKLIECLAGKTIQYEMRCRFPDNSERDLLVSYLPIEGPGGVDRVACVLQDITERKQTEQARERGLSLMLATLESTADGILVVNTEGKIETFNRIFVRMWRLPDEVLASKEDARALECVLDQLVEPEQFLEKVSYLYHHPEEESFDRLLFKDGRVFERYSRPQLIGGEVVGRVWSFRDITDRNQAREALQKANRQLRTLSRRLFNVQEQEKRHLARELHDEIGQALTAVKINLTSLGSANGDNSLRLEETIALLDNLLRQVRQISLDLHPSLLDDLGLAAALRSLLDQQARRAGLQAQFCAAQLTDNIDVAISSTAFRIAQEAITNVLRHAKANLIKVHLRTESGRLRIEVADDGAGFDVAEARQRSHHQAGFGLMGMKERAALVGGDVEVNSSRGTGTSVQISLPLKENGSTP